VSDYLIPKRDSAGPVEGVNVRHRADTGLTRGPGNAGSRRNFATCVLGFVTKRRFLRGLPSGASLTSGTHHDYSTFPIHQPVTRAIVGAAGAAASAAGYPSGVDDRAADGDHRSAGTHHRIPDGSAGEAGAGGRVLPPRGRGTHPWHWWLTPAGARLITGTACAEDRGGPNPLFVRHAAATADMWLALPLAGPAAGLELRQWWRDNDGWTEWQPAGWGLGGRVRRITPDPAGWGLGGRVRRITPDATAHLTVGGLTAGGGGGDGPALGAVLIEIDLATMTQQRLGYKLARYRDYAADHAWRGTHPHCPVLLVLTTTPARAATFLRGAEKLLPAPTPIQFEDDWPYEAGRLVVAACGHVRDPKVAVTERVWMLPGDTAEITLTDLLTDRVQVARRAHAVEVATARRKAHHHWNTTVEALAGDRRAAPALTGDPAAQQVLRALQAAGTQVLGRWAAAAGPAGRGLIGWWEPYATTSRYSQAEPPPTNVVFALSAEYPSRWRAQAARLSAAAGPVAAEAPVWHAAATRLLAGELLAAADLDGAAGAVESRAAAQLRLWQSADSSGVDYPTRRERAVTAKWASLGRRERWHASVQELAARYDEQFLDQCPVCRLLIPTPLPERACPGCGISWGHTYPVAGTIPAMHAALNAALDGLAPVPPAAPVMSW
jgi:hypothetical protein